MRLREVERGERLGDRLLFRIASLALRARFPDAARMAFYHRGWVGGHLSEWTQAAMRGPSGWSGGERELMAAMVAQWNSCAFCVGAHRATAARGLDTEVVEACLADYRTAPISERLRATLEFLETMTRDPDDLDASSASRARKAGVSRDDLVDACAVATTFGIVNRCADALGFEVPGAEEFDRSAAFLLRRGYR